MYEYEASLISIHDGDTLRLSIDLGFSVHFLTPNPENEPQSIRFLGYDAPELKARKADPNGLGEEARDAVAAWFGLHPPPYTVKTEKDRTEKFGRYLIRSLTSADTHELIGDQVQAGYLKPYSGSGPKPVWP